MLFKEKISEELTSIRGVFYRRMNLWQATALIVSSTIGAGVLGLPYAIAQSGASVGFLYIVFLGFLMMTLNLMLGRVVSVQKERLQLSGLARKYLGRWGGYAMTVLLYCMLVGVLVIYIIGEGRTLSTLFGGNPSVWSLIFFAVAFFLIIIGMRTVKIIQSVLVVGLLTVIFLIVLASIPRVEVTNLMSYDLAELLFPYGVILFAFHSTSSIPETYSTIRGKYSLFRKAIVYSSVIAIIVYAAFGLLAVGVMGNSTTELATVGLEQFLGREAFIFGNIFALIAMGMSFLMVGLSLRDSLVWDHKIKPLIATFFVGAIPLSIFLLGARSFIGMIDIVGGVLVSLEMLLIVLIYWQAHRQGDLMKKTFPLHHIALLSIPLILALAVGAVYSVGKLF